MERTIHWYTNTSVYDNFLVSRKDRRPRQRLALPLLFFFSFPHSPFFSYIFALAILMAFLDKKHIMDQHGLMRCIGSKSCLTTMLFPERERNESHTYKHPIQTQQSQGKYTQWTETAIAAPVNDLDNFNISCPTLFSLDQPYQSSPRSSNVPKYKHIYTYIGTRGWDPKGFKVHSRFFLFFFLFIIFLYLLFFLVFHFFGSVKRRRISNYAREEPSSFTTGPIIIFNRRCTISDSVLFALTSSRLSPSS